MCIPSLLAAAAFLAGSACSKSPSGADAASAGAGSAPEAGASAPSEGATARGGPAGAVATLTTNGGFEAGDDSWADRWVFEASQPPVRTTRDAHSGSHSMHSAIVNVGARPAEGLLSQYLEDCVQPGRSYRLSFRVKQVDLGPGYVQQYEVQFLDEDGDPVDEGRSFVDFRAGSMDAWEEVTAPGLLAPPGAHGVRILFRMVTGAVEGGSGEIFLDDVTFAPEPAA